MFIDQLLMHMWWQYIVVVTVTFIYAIDLLVVSGGSETSGVVVNNSNSSTTIGSIASMQATVGQAVNKSISSLQHKNYHQQHHHPLSSSLPVGSGNEMIITDQRDTPQSQQNQKLLSNNPQQQQQQHLAITQQEDNSEGDTLVRQWSVRSGADTLDSELIAAGRCVACLPVSNCLRMTRPAAAVAAASTAAVVMKVERPTNLGGMIISVADTESGTTSGRRRHQRHQRKNHRLQQQRSPGIPVSESAASVHEAAARYNMSLAESTSGSSSESEFESDVCSTGAETSSSSNSSRRVEDDEVERDHDHQASQGRLQRHHHHHHQQQQQHHGFRRLLSGAHNGGVRPILSSFNQHRYRLQQNWREVEGDRERSLAGTRQYPVIDSKSVVGASHGWLASAKRLTSALSESLTRRALSSNPPLLGKPSPFPTPQVSLGCLGLFYSHCYFTQLCRFLCLVVESRSEVGWHCTGHSTGATAIVKLRLLIR